MLPHTQSTDFASVEEAVTEISAGRCVVVVDDESRENEGDLICAADRITPGLINLMITEGRGCLCLPITESRAQQLDLPLMVEQATSHLSTAFTVTIDADIKFGVSTGVSTFDRARTIQVAVSPDCRPTDLRRPGHVFPLIAKPGGVLERNGHTEAAIDLARLAGCIPAGVLCEILNQDGTMARLPDLKLFGRKHRLKLISIAQLIEYRLQHDHCLYQGTHSGFPHVFTDSTNLSAV